MRNFQVFGFAAMLLGPPSAAVTAEELEPSSASTPQQIAVWVLNEKNEGVVSAVMRGPQWTRLGGTDEAGALSVAYVCKVGEVLKARPQDSALYFDSRPEECGPEVELRVVSRRTPAGHSATDFRIYQIDESPGNMGEGIAVAWSVLDTNVRETGDVWRPFFDNRECRVDFSSTIEVAVFAYGANAEWIRGPEGEIGRVSASDRSWRAPCSEVMGSVESEREELRIELEQTLQSVGVDDLMGWN